MNEFISEASFWMPESLAPSAWTEHAPFAFWLTDVHRPRLVVELGTHFGFSYFAFNQAVERLQIKSRCFAVDTWKGDEHAGCYGDDVFEQVHAYNEAHYADFSELIRSTFDDAVNAFQDGTIDLLHVDGRHFYEDVKHDFETWRSKLSNRAVVLFHDTNVRARDFGVYKLWEELKLKYRYFEFLEGHGLGLFAYGDDLPECLKHLFAASTDSNITEKIRRVYGRLGSAVLDRAKLSGAVGPQTSSGSSTPEADKPEQELFPQQSALEQDSDELPQQGSARSQLENDHQELREAYSLLEAELQQIKQTYQELETFLEKQNGHCRHFQLDNIDLKTKNDGLVKRQRELEQSNESLVAEHAAMAKLYHQVGEEMRKQQEVYEELVAAHNLREAQLQEASTQLEHLRPQLLKTEREYAQLQQVSSEVLAERNHARGEISVRNTELKNITSSVSWRITSPFRWIVRKTPWVKRTTIVPIKLLWWLITLQLFRRLKFRRLRKLIADSRLFDRQFYLTQNPDVADAGMDPLGHYLWVGAQEGRDPHPLFSSSWYLAENPDVSAAGLNPLVHYLVAGRQEGRAPNAVFDPKFYAHQLGAALPPDMDALEHFLNTTCNGTLDPHPLFDTLWYLSQNPDVAQANVNPLIHYLTQGWREERDPHPLFSSSWYLQASPEAGKAAFDGLTHYIVHGWKARISPHPIFDLDFYLEQNPDVAEAGIEPIEHYMRIGAYEGRDPHPAFDSSWYLEQSPDVAKALINPLRHFLQYGWQAGYSPHPLFEMKWYLDQNPDVATAGLNPLDHYLQQGGEEGRDPHPLFDSDWYLEQNPDVRTAAFNPLAHYLRHGWKEGRSPHKYFDVAFYLKENPDVEWAHAEPLGHYLQRGASEDRDPNPLFDTDWYVEKYSDVRTLGINPLVHYVQWGEREGRFSRPQPTVIHKHRKPRVVFISGEAQTPGHQYRVLNFAKALAPQFFETAVIAAEEISVKAGEVAGADVLWIWRAAWSRDIAALIDTAQHSGAKIIFDIDDLMFRPELAAGDAIDGIRSQNFPRDVIKDHFGRIQALLLRADHCTSPTTTLTLEIRNFAKPASLIPNGFDADTVQLARSVRRGASVQNDVIRIGYASGSLTHQKDLGVASRSVAAVLAENPKVRLVLFRKAIEIAEFPEFHAVRDQIEWRDVVPIKELPSEYARFDVNIAPLEVGNQFCEAKSELKYFEAALVGVPTIASPTRPFAEAIRQGENGFLARNDHEWYEFLNSLVRDHELRRRIANRAYSEVLWFYGPERRSLLVNDLVNQLLSPPSVRSQLFAFDVTARRSNALLPIDVPDVDIVFESPRRGLSRVAVVIPLFNYGHLLPEALESVRRQTVRNIDLVVVDDLSTDNSAEVARAWLTEHAFEFNAVALLRNRKNSKLGATRNIGVSFCDTEFFLPLDPDNLILPECIEKCMKLLDETGAAFAYPTMEVFGEEAARFGITRMGTAEFNPAFFQGANYIDAMALVRKACWIAVGGYSALDPTGWEDYDFWCKLVEKGFFGVRVGETLAKYRVHGTSMLSTITDPKKAQVIKDILTRHPWLELSVSEAGSTQTAPSHTSSSPIQLSTSFENRYPLDRLVPILRCPETRERLVLRDHDTLISQSGSRVWPIVNGRPVFTPDARNVFNYPKTHTSNQLPQEAIQIIQQTSGIVLNLSAGATTTHYPNVVELEYSIFKNTDVIGDVHRLPFQDEVFEAVVCLNAFEHYREPDRAMEEIRRVLKPCGRLFLHTAFLQPLHEAPHHYYDCTEFGLRHWLRNFQIEELRVSNNFNPVYVLSWLASEMESGFLNGVSSESAQAFRDARLQEFVAFWRDPETRMSELWKMFYCLPSDTQKQFAAGWESIATKQG